MSCCNKASVYLWFSLRVYTMSATKYRSKNSVVCSRKRIKTYNLKVSFHFGESVCGLTLVARMYRAGSLPRLSRCCRPSRLLKLSLNPCLRPSSSEARGEAGSDAGWIPSMQYGSLKPTIKKHSCSTCRKCILLCMPKSTYKLRAGQTGVNNVWLILKFI